jgi:hypothetical protein
MLPVILRRFVLWEKMTNFAAEQPSVEKLTILSAGNFSEMHKRLISLPQVHPESRK